MFYSNNEKTCDTPSMFDYLLIINNSGYSLQKILFTIEKFVPTDLLTYKQSNSFGSLATK